MNTKYLDQYDFVKFHELNNQTIAYWAVTSESTEYVGTISTTGKLLTKQKVNREDILKYLSECIDLLETKSLTFYTIEDPIANQIYLENHYDLVTEKNKCVGFSVFGCGGRAYRGIVKINGGCGIIEEV